MTPPRPPTDGRDDTQDVFVGAPPPSVTTIHAPLPRRMSKPPPPPIFVRTATDAGARPDLFDQEDDRAEAQEAEDTVPDLNDLPPTPNKRHSLNFDHPVTPTRMDGQRSPASPSWAPLEMSPQAQLREFGASPRARPPTWHHMDRPASWHRNSLEVPAFYVAPSPQEKPTRAFEPTPQHGLHARNLSAYFPHPGVPARAPSPTPAQPAGDSVIPDADKSAFGAGADYAAPPPVEEATERPRTSKRRGHHHRHSLSHNFFSFLDPTQTNPHAATPPSDAGPTIPINLSPADDKPHPVPMDVASSPATLSPLPPGKKDPQAQALVSFAVIEAVLGVGLWVEGQMSGWRCLTAVGYLVVFDAMGMGVNLFARTDRLGWRSLRRPYGSSRVTSMLCFSQSVFLIFAAVYIAKEAVEQVVLGASAHDHAAASGHSHGHHDHGSGDERPFPQLLLLLASVATLFSGAVLANHSRLVDATGPLFLPPWYLANSVVRDNGFLSNPFTLSIAGTCALLFLASLVVPTASLSSLDAIASLVLAFLTASLAHPPAVAFAHVLLQTAPPASSSQMKALRRALRDVADDRRVLGLGTLRCWTINAGKMEPEAMTTSSAPPSRRGSFTAIRPSVSTISPSTQAFTDSPRASQDIVAQLTREGDTDAPLVVTLVVHVHPETSDSEILEVTRVSWSKLSSAISCRQSAGEVSVQVRRGWEGAQ
ncbi:hypothetical protein CC85DRAFT_287658 [Cutaneotrichosporon oleaginosum]|uniref:Cation efflux protein transmembrane domain-containing protein n=1 Tax=Cutaneotrichosporon oleaginosum TaxID=879819 RepID=A0A0J0XGT9_9TREE|nr:uncharacterized protein CC85DRAFT_287658 [Cutaneotrichosporon oleaginosum]KLT40247.1 hypothetical protein CC85DRAFT_287658 [Cutaneotrichosporon oleaginosum]TXT11303.1 hypothetical protein COLE_01713 [Cutaneotrichosporon oleaginosum]